MTGRVTYRDRGARFQITIAPKITMLQLLVILATFSPFIIFLIRFLQNMKDAIERGSLLPLLGGLLFWGISGIFWLYSILVNSYGREIVDVTDETVSIRKSFLGRGPVKEYRIDGISHMRVYGSHASTIPFIGKFIPTGVSIVFDYGGRTQRFGNQLLEREARFMLDRLQTKLPPSAFTEEQRKLNA